MTTSKVDICNLALMRIGHSKRISALSSTAPASQAEAYCAEFYDYARQEALRLAPWSFATAEKTLALLSSYEPTQWTYAYSYPSDCLKARRLLTGAGNDEPAFSIGYYDGQKVIKTNQAEAILEYTIDVDDPSLYDPSFASVIAWRLAIQLIGPMARKRELLEIIMDAYRIDLSDAMAQNTNEDGGQRAVDDSDGVAYNADWLEARN